MFRTDGNVGRDRQGGYQLCFYVYVFGDTLVVMLKNV